MAFTTPGTAVAGEVLTAAFWNTNVRDNLNDIQTRVLDTGLVHLNTTTLSATATVNVDGVFTSTYENYMVVFGAVASGGIDVNYKLRKAGSVASTNYQR